MKTIFACVTSALALLSLPAAAAESQGWYVGGGAGANWMAGTADFTGIPDTGMHYRPNSRFSVDLGYKWNNWRFEIEPNWVTSDAGLTGFTGGTTVAALLGNVLYDFDLGDHWMLTAGAGIGGARVSHDVVNIASGDLFLGGHGAGLAWQGIAGVSYGLTRNIELGLEYRFMGTGDDHAVSQYAPVRFENGQNQLVMASLRWFPFAHEEAAPPPPPPPPAPPPPPPPPPPAPIPLPPPVRTFVVFFDFDKSDINQDARQIIAQAVQVVKQNGFVRIQVTGHTDTMGSAGYNQKLSERRAVSVKSLMVSLGVPEGEITTAGRSFNDPLVSTGPRMREPKNRRAVIDLDK